jgi:hypothetical protein
MRYIFLLVLSGMAAGFLVQWSFNKGAAFGDAQGYSRGYAEGKRVEPDLSVCYGYWFGGTAGRDRMRELKNVCKGMK